MSCKTWFLGLAASVATLLHAVEPWALWTNFTGAGAEDGLAPQVSSVQNNIDGGAWRFRLAGEASVDTNGVLSTGTTSAPHIDFDTSINLGYGANPFTVVMAVRNVGTTTGKPLCIAGSSIGMALTAINKTAGTATIKGMWSNVVWNNGNNVARSVDTLAGTGVTVLAMNCAGSSSSGGVTVKTVGASGVTSLDTWNGLRGSPLNIQRIFFGNTNNADSGGLNFELLAVAVYREMPADADLTWLVDAAAVYTWKGTSETFHNGPWKTTTRYACAEESGRSSRTWAVFANAVINNQNLYVAPGRILRFAAPAEAGGVFVGGLDAQFAPFNLGGLIVEPGAKGYSFQSSTSSTRTLDLGDIASTPRASAFVFHEDFTVNRVATGGQSDTTTFHGPASVIIDAGKTFTISEEAAVASGATVTVSGGGTLALGKTLAMAGSLTIQEGTLSIPNLDLGTTPVTLGAKGALAVRGTLTLHDTTPVRLATLPATIDLSAICSAPNATYASLITFVEGVTPDWGNVAFAWGDVGEQPGFVTVTTDETGLSVTVNRTEDNFIVMPMGDSITEGSGNVENAPSYRKALAERMMAAGMNPRFVGARIYKSTPIANEDCRNHTGLSGQRVQSAGNRGGYLQGAPNWLEQAGYPDAITLMIGTNDSTTATGDQAVADAEAAFGRWKALVKTMAEVRPNTWIIVAPITPTRAERTNIKAFNHAYNARIKSLFAVTESTVEVNGEQVPCVLGTLNAAGEEAFGAGAKVIMASMFDALPEESNAGYFHDNTHPNQAGYDRMAAVWLEAIKTLRGEQGGLKDAEAIVDVYQTAGAMDRVTVVFNRQQRETAGVTVTVGGTAAEVSERTLSADGRRVTLMLAAPLAEGAEVTVGKGTLSRTFTAKGTAAENRVGEAQRKGYVAVKALDLPLKGAFNDEAKAKAAFTALEGAEGIAAFDRMGYYVTLARPDGALRWLWVTMDRPAAYATVEALGLPTANLRTKVYNLRVASNVPGIDPVTEDGVQGLLQFGPNNISPAAADTAHPVAISGSIYDWNTTFGPTAYGYGAMQVFRLYEEGVGRADSGMPASTLFSYSRWATAAAGNDEITLGDLANHQGYASGTQDAASLTSIFTTGFPTLNTAAYSVKRIEIWVRPTTAHTWAGATEGTWNKTATDIWRENVPFADGTAAIFDALNGGATAATVTVGEAVAPSALTVAQNAYTFTGAAITADALTVAANASATFESALTTKGVSVVAGTLSVDTATFEQTPTGTGTLVKTGTGELALELPSASVIPSYEVLGGKLTLTKPLSGNGAAFSGDVAPSFKVASGAHLVWDANDLVGWSRENTVTVAEVSGVLEKVRAANETFSGRIVLKNGGELRNSAANHLMLWKSAVVETEANAKASITGESIKAGNDTPELLVGENAVLTISAPLAIPSGITLKKSGDGVAYLTGAVTGVGNSWGTLNVAKGTLKTALSGSLDATLTVAAGATLELTGNLGKGGLPATVNGRLIGHGKFFGGNSNATLTFGDTAKLVAPATLGETLEVAPGNAQAATLSAGATFVAGAGKLLLTNGYAKRGEGTFAIALPDGITLALGESLPVLTVGDGKTVDVADFAAPQGLTCYVEGQTLSVGNLIAVERPEGAAETPWAPTTLKTVSAAIHNLGEAATAITRVTKVEVSTKGGTARSAEVAKVNDVLACFQGGAIATTTDDPIAATVTVHYEFGVSAIAYDPTDNTISITVRVQGAEAAPATFANGVTLELFAAEGDSTTLATITPNPGTNEATFRLSDFPEWLTRPFKVRATR